MIEYRPDGVEVELPMVRTVVLEDPGDSTTFRSANEALRPTPDGTVAERWRVPPRPRLAREIVELAEDPAMTLGGWTGPLAIVNSGLTTKLTDTE